MDILRGYVLQLDYAHIIIIIINSCNDIKKNDGTNLGEVYSLDPLLYF